jgi:parallel beta-helix repeat protein
MVYAQVDNRSVVFYVAPDGSDRWSGKMPAPDKGMTDGPFATLQRASDAIIELKKQQEGELNQPVNISIREGIYMPDNPLVLTQEHSGTVSCPVVFTAYKNEKPVISGGRYITGWKRVKVNGRQLWSANLRKGKWLFNELWVNNQRRYPARYPKKGYLAVENAPDVTEETQWQDGQNRFLYKKGDLKAWDTVSHGELVVMTKWVESRLPIVSIDEQRRIVTCSKKSCYMPEPGDLYYVENILEVLDSPGEWYLDRKAGNIYYMPVKGEDMAKTTVIAPALTQVINIQGKPEAGKFAENIKFKDLTFSHTGLSVYDTEKVGFYQAAFGVPGMVYGEGIRNCSFENCDFIHFGTYAVELARGCSNNSIAGCNIYDTGAGGIKLGERQIRENEQEQTHDNEITDCSIYDGGLLFHSAVGILIFQSYDNLISHNHIHDFYYTGISAGWTWGYGKSLAKGNIIEFNNVHHIGVRSDGDGPVLSDMGGIYTLGIQPGTVIRNNIFHDIAGFRYGGWGIYFDEGSTDILAENNIVYNTTHGGFHQHYGKDNIVQNNIFAFGRDAQIQRTRQDTHFSFAFKHNIVYWKQGNLLAGNFKYFNDFYDSYFKQVYLTSGISDNKSPYLFKKFILTDKRDKALRRGIIPVDRLKSPVDIDGDFNDLKGIKPILLSRQNVYAEDLSAEVYLAWDEQNFYFAAKVRDNVLRNLFTGGNVWQGDGIQVAFDTLNNAEENSGYDKDDYELGFTLTKEGPQAYCWVASTGSKEGIRDDIKLAVKRENGFTFYKAAIPLKELLPLKPEVVFGFSFGVNDDDSKDSDYHAFDYNIYFDAARKPVSFNYSDKESTSLEGWRKFGLDTHSVIADPLFVAPKKNNFDLKSKSPAFKLGFKAISIKNIGPRAR